MAFIRILSSEWIKTKRTATRWIVFMTPVIYPVFMLWYYSKTAGTLFFQINIYDGFYEVISVAVPFIAAMLTSLSAIQEEGAESFIGILKEPASRTKLYLGKLTILIIYMVTDVFIAAILMLLGMKFLLKVENIQYSLFFQGSLYVIAGSLILFAVHLFISYAYGIGPSLAIGGAGFLISAIVGATSLGDSIWQFVPWAWACRLSRNPAVLMPGVKLPGIASVRAFFYNELLKGIIPSAVCFIIAASLSILWFNGWSGRKSYD